MSQLSNHHIDELDQLNGPADAWQPPPAADLTLDGILSYLSIDGREPVGLPADHVGIYFCVQWYLARFRGGRYISVAFIDRRNALLYATRLLAQVGDEEVKAVSILKFTRGVNGAPAVAGKGVRS